MSARGSRGARDVVGALHLRRCALGGAASAPPSPPCRRSSDTTSPRFRMSSSGASPRPPINPPQLLSSFESVLRTHFHSQASPPQAGTRSQGPESGADPRRSLSRRRMSLLTSGLRRSAAAMSAFLAPAHRHPIPPSRLACFSRLASVCTTEQFPTPLRS